MKKKVCLDKKKRNLNVKIENKQYVLKSLYKNIKINKTIRWNSSLKISSKLGNTNQFVSRCIFSGQKKKINNSFNVSRLSFLKFARNGFISGISKSTW
tara:strand:- start:15501 stop:15794 length:294 start_codon:yes stop_codon:yes gene_type:complete